jgi:hypothetical protein
MSGFAARHSRTVPSRASNWSCAQGRAHCERTHACRKIPDTGGATCARARRAAGGHLIVAQVGADEQVVGGAPRVQRRARHAGAPGVRVHRGPRRAVCRRPLNCSTRLVAHHRGCTSGVLSESFVTAHSDFAQFAQPCRRCLRAGEHRGCHGAPCRAPPPAKLAATLRCSSGSIKAQSVSVTAAPRSASACDPTLLRSAAGERAECC